jgi:hypothetical protein
LLTFRSWLQARAYKWFRFRPPIPFSYAYVGFFVVQ